MRSDKPLWQLITAGPRREDPFHASITHYGLCLDFVQCSCISSYGAKHTTGNGFEMDAIAMAVFGGISSTGGKETWPVYHFRIHHRMLTSWSWTEEYNAQVILLIIRCTSGSSS